MAKQDVMFAFLAGAATIGLLFWASRGFRLPGGRVANPQMFLPQPTYQPAGITTYFGGDADLPLGHGYPGFGAERKHLFGQESSVQDRNLRQIELAKIPRGEGRLSETITQTRYIKLRDPWINLNLVNDGPNPVYLSLNDANVIKDTPINAGESYSFNGVVPSISAIGLDVASGDTASIRARGEVGSWEFFGLR